MKKGIMKRVLAIVAAVALLACAAPVMAERKEDCGNHPGNPDLPFSAEEVEDTPGRTQHEREPQEPDRNSDESCRRELSAMDVKEEKQDVMGQEP